MPDLGLWAVPQTELARSVSAQRVRAGIFRHIQSITFFITYFTTEFIFWKLSYCNLKHLKCSTFSETLVNSFGKDRGEILLNQNNKQTLWENVVFILSSKSGCFDLLAPVSTFISIWHDTMLVTLGFCGKKLWIQRWKAALAYNVLTIPYFRRWNDVDVYKERLLWRHEFRAILSITSCWR